MITFNKIKFAYHCSRGEKLLHKYGECLKNGEIEKAKKLWDKAYDHKRKINQIGRGTI